MRETERPAQHIVLLLTDLVGSAALKTRFGTASYANLISRHDELFRTIMSSIAGSEIVKDTGDGFLARFTTTRDAVNAALRFQCAIHTEAWEPQPLQVRIGVHVGDVLHLDQDIDGRPKLVGLTADITARVTELALPGQILMTRSAFDDARQYVHEHPLVDAGVSERPRLKWMAHGAYLLKGVDEPVEVFEVGAAGLAPLKVPPSGGKAQRIVLADEEETLGWRPAAGLDVPQRENWRLRRKLGEGGFGEVWLAQNRQTHVERVFKFCFDAERVRSLKREVTLFRLLRDALGNRDDIATLYEIQLEHAPYCLESEFTELGSMSDWAERQGGLEAVPLATRLDLVARTADAVAAAHSIGILHKDIKPSNVLVYQAADGSPRPRLADFGIGALTDQAQLERRNITATGFTETLVTDMQSSLTGTRMYAPPELLAGKPFTIQGDVYALGVLLYQMLVGDLTRPVATGWERDVSDPLLREDVAACVDGEPARRLSGATELAERLRSLEERHKKRQQEEDARLWARRREKLVRRAVAASIVLGLLLVLAAFSFYRERTLRLEAAEARRRAEDARQVAEEQHRLAEKRRRDAENVTAFLQEMLASFDPAQTQGREATVRVVLDQAAQRLGTTLVDQPEVQAAVRETLGRTYRTLGFFAQAEQQLRSAYDTRREMLGDDHELTVQAMSNLGLALQDQGKLAEAEPLYRQVLEYLRQERGATDQRTLLASNNLGWLLWSQGKRGEAEKLFREVLEIRRRTLGDDDPETLRTMTNLAGVLREQDKLDEADLLSEQALAGSQEVLGDQHPQTLYTRRIRIWVLKEFGKLDEAEVLGRRALTIDRQVLGDEHPHVLYTVNALAAVLQERGKLDEAERLYRQTYERRCGMLGAEHLETLVSMNGLGNVLYRMGRLAEAEALFVQLLEIRRRKSGDEHPDTLGAMDNLALVWHAQGKLAAAETLFRQTLADRRRVLGSEHVDTLSSMSNLALVLQDQDKLAEAEMLLRQAFEIARTRLPQKHWFRGVLQAKYGNCLVRLGRYAEAEEHLLASHAELSDVLDATDARVQTVLSGLADLYSAWGKPDQAAEWWAKLTATQPAQSAPNP
jgi:class 3 adenylate cyclase/serine/threonine protein kinase